MGIKVARLSDLPGNELSATTSTRAGLGHLLPSAGLRKTYRSQHGFLFLSLYLGPLNGGGNVGMDLTHGSGHVITGYAGSLHFFHHLLLLAVVVRN